jgi:hypothetical protein
LIWLQLLVTKSNQNRNIYPLIDILYPTFSFSRFFFFVLWSPFKTCDINKTKQENILCYYSYPRFFFVIIWSIFFYFFIIFLTKILHHQTYIYNIYIYSFLLMWMIKQQVCHWLLCNALFFLRLVHFVCFFFSFIFSECNFLCAWCGNKTQRHNCLFICRIRWD